MTSANKMTAGPRAKQVILILGMHRSGTSALAQIMHALGADIPSNLMPADQHNHNGYYESLSIYKLNDDMLKSAGSAWNDWQQIDSGWLQTPVAQRFKIRAINILHQEFGNSTLFVLKDPRICRLLPIWLDILEAFGATPLPVIITRNPLEVAASLYQRDHISLQNASLIWLRHVLELECHTRNLSRTFCTYSQVLEDVNATVMRISNQLPVTWPQAIELAQPDFKAYIKKTLRHHAFSQTELQNHSGLNAWVQPCYLAFKALSREKPDELSLETLTTIRHELNHSESFLRKLFPQGFVHESMQESLVHQITQENTQLTNKLSEVNIRHQNLESGYCFLEQHFFATHALNRNIIEQIQNFKKGYSWRLLQLSFALEAKCQKLTTKLSLISQSACTILGSKKMLQKQLQSDLLKSGLFDIHWYLENNQDVVFSPQSAITHWLEKGWLEGRNPCALFHTRWYLDEYNDVAEAGINPLVHYLHRANHERRFPNPLFDSQWYLAQYPDVAADGYNPLSHYIHIGVREGHNPNPLFDSHWYLSQYPEVAAAGLNPLTHYLETGYKEGRKPNPLFDSRYYLRKNQDIAAAGLNPLAHYINNGSSEGRRPNRFFDSYWYLQQNQDIADAGINPLAHYLQTGYKEGRNPNQEFNSRWYLKQHPKLQSTDINPLAHFIQYEAKDYAVSEPTPRDLDKKISAWNDNWESLHPSNQLIPDRILIADNKIPTPDLDSGSLRFFKILECLANSGFTVDLLVEIPGYLKKYKTAVETLGVNVIVGLESALEHVMQFGSYYHAVILSRPDVYARYIAIVRAYAVQARVFYDTVDLHWIRFQRNAKISSNPERLHEQAENYKRLELANATSADVTIAISVEESHALKTQLPEIETCIIPNIHQVSKHIPTFQQRQGLFFIGGFDHAPNVDAIHYLVEDILPLIIKQIPDIRIRLVGSNMPYSIIQLACTHVEPIGYVEDITPLFNQARIFVTPLRYGAGLKGKMGQCLSYGLPAITTDIGAEGMGLIHGHNALIANSTETFANEIIRLYNDDSLWQQLSDNGRQLIAEQFSESVVKDKILSAIFPESYK